MIKKTDIGVGLYLLAAVIFFIIPIPSFLLDVMLAINISIALIILFDSLFVKEVLDEKEISTSRSISNNYCWCNILN